MYNIRTIAQLVTALGGDTALSERLGICQEAVANWKARNAIPGGWHLRLYSECLGKGKSVDPRVFGLREKDMQPIMLHVQKKRGRSKRSQPAA